MTNEQRKAIDRLEKLVRLRKSRNTIKYDNCICSTEDLDAVLSLIKEQDKQIDLMAEHIHINDCYECPNIKCEDDGSITCEDCIKQYFERKVEDVES